MVNFFFFFITHSLLIYIEGVKLLYTIIRIYKYIYIYINYFLVGYRNVELI